MKLNKNLKSILILLTIVVVFFAWEYYHNRNCAKELKDRFEQENCKITMEGYEFGIFKKEFDKLYPRISESLKYVKYAGYIDKGNIIKTFHGIKVKQTQFSFRDNVFSGTFVRADFFNGIGFNLTDITDSDISKLKSIFANNDWSGIEDFNEDGSIDYSNQRNDINNCVEVTLIYTSSDNSAFISFSIREEIIYQY